MYPNKPPTVAGAAGAPARLPSVEDHLPSVEIHLGNKKIQPGSPPRGEREDCAIRGSVGAQAMNSSLIEGDWWGALINVKPGGLEILDDGYPIDPPWHSSPVRALFLPSVLVDIHCARTRPVTIATVREQLVLMDSKDVYALIGREVPVRIHIETREGEIGLTEQDRARLKRTGQQFLRVVDVKLRTVYGIGER
jgi:hypothetical protein